MQYNYKQQAESNEFPTFQLGKIVNPLRTTHITLQKNCVFDKRDKRPNSSLPTQYRALSFIELYYSIHRKIFIKKWRFLIFVSIQFFWFTKLHKRDLLKYMGAYIFKTLVENILFQKDHHKKLERFNLLYYIISFGLQRFSFNQKFCKNYISNFSNLRFY